MAKIQDTSRYEDTIKVERFKLECNSKEKEILYKHVRKMFSKCDKLAYSPKNEDQKVCIFTETEISEGKSLDFNMEFVLKDVVEQDLLKKGKYEFFLSSDRDISRLKDVTNLSNPKGVVGNISCIISEFKDHIIVTLTMDITSSDTIKNVCSTIYDNILSTLYDTSIAISKCITILPADGVELMRVKVINKYYSFIVGGKDVETTFKRMMQFGPAGIMHDPNVYFVNSDKLKMTSSAVDEKDVLSVIYDTLPKEYNHGVEIRDEFWGGLPEDIPVHSIGVTPLKNILKDKTDQGKWDLLDNGDIFPLFKLSKNNPTLDVQLSRLISKLVLINNDMNPKFTKSNIVLV